MKPRKPPTWTPTHCPVIWPSQLLSSPITLSSSTWSCPPWGIPGALLGPAEMSIGLPMFALLAGMFVPSVKPSPAVLARAEEDSAGAMMKPPEP